MSKKTSEIETKSENKQAVYRFIRTNESATKQDIYIGLGLSLPTIKQSLEFLEKEELICASDVVRNTGGRNAAAYRILPDGRFSVGLFLTSNHITAVCVDLSGTIIGKIRERISLDVHNDAYLKKMGDMVASVILEAKIEESKLLGVGIAVPSLVSEDGESIIFGMTHDFSGITRKILSKYIPYPTKLFHDSFAGGFAEVWKTSNIKNAIYINLNSSIGGSIIINNQVFNGNNQRSGEIGHMILYPKIGKRCYCGQIGCLDTVCNSGVLDSYTNGNLKEFFDLVNAKDPTALELWDTYLDNLALAIHNIRMLHDCEIILGGYVGSYMEDYMEDLCKKVDSYSIFNCFSREYILPCQYKNESTAAGAAIQVIENYINTL